MGHREKCIVEHIVSYWCSGRVDWATPNAKQSAKEGDALVLVAPEVQIVSSTEGVIIEIINKLMTNKHKMTTTTTHLKGGTLTECVQLSIPGQD